MSTLLFFVLIGLASAFFNSSKKKPNQSISPIENESKPTVAIKTLDDFTKEVMKELSEKTITIFEQPKQEKMEVNTIPIQVQTEQVPIKRETLQQRNMEHLNQKPVDFKQTIPSENKKQSKLPFTTSKDMLVNAIIAQEILGPPKAKQR